MKGLDVFIVRFAPFVLYILFGLDLLLANLGDRYIFDLLLA